MPRIPDLAKRRYPDAPKQISVYESQKFNLQCFRGPDASVCAEKQQLTRRNGEGVSALIVGGARIRADMRLRSKQQRRVMNAELSNGICLA